MLGLFAPQIQWMEGRPGDAWGLSYLLLARWLLARYGL
jgi:hypothetical protein